jgi:NAD(P)-dependent dehydrogenase (short-subunit alcohol dehydrogenase family)
METLRDKVAVVTGAASGIGGAIACALAERGAHLGGHLVNTASFAGLFTYSYDRLPYAATKAALVQISEVLAIHLQPAVIGVTLMSTGPVLTNIAAAVPKSGDPVAVGELIPRRDPAEPILRATHPHVVDELRRRVADWDAYLDYQISREPN